MMEVELVEVEEQWSEGDISDEVSSSLLSMWSVLSSKECCDNKASNNYF